MVSREKPEQEQTQLSLVLVSWLLLGTLLAPLLVYVLLHVRARPWARAQPFVIWLGVDPDEDAGPSELGPARYFLSRSGVTPVAGPTATPPARLGQRVSAPMPQLPAGRGLLADLRLDGADAVVEGGKSPCAGWRPRPWNTGKQGPRAREELRGGGREDPRRDSRGGLGWRACRSI
ncbi:uncharacterized protein LOC113208410 [Frankliniella occidentalis]|uniref:Uncharacterized protein LOC113208410 n=1 Tax=Frankliniella occidentalis TaxID=133901 RepID=A0A9C6U5V0_FRAOC|nr:uncharacterized protein LOC113208410 [Frankliniella occidentalis]